MKIRVICVLFVLFFGVVALSPTLFAQNSPFGTASDYLPNEVYDYLTQEDVKALEESRSDVGAIFSRIRSIWDAVQPQLTQAFCQMLGLLLLFGAFRVLHGVADSDFMTTVSALAFSLYTYQLLSDLWEQAYAAMQSMHQIMTVLTPTVTTLYLLGGNETTAIVQGSLLTWFLGIMQTVMTNLFLPAVQILMGLTFVGRVTGGSAYGSLTLRLRRGLTWAIGIFFGILALVLGYQTSIAASADRIGAKTLKFAFGSLIPVAGGAISESVRILLGSLSVLRSVTGTVGILCVMGIILPPVVITLCQMLLFSILSFIAERFGCQAEGAFFSQLGEILKLILLFLVAYALFFVFFLTLFSNSTAAYHA